MAGFRKVPELLRQHPLAVAIPWAFALFFAGAWALDLYPAEPIWGTFADWFTGAATAGGLVFAALQIRNATLQQRSAQEADRLFQSRAVAIASGAKEEEGSWLVTYEVSNSSDQPVFSVVVLILTPGADVAASFKQSDAIHEVYIGTLIAHGTHTKSVPVKFPRDPTPGEAVRICGLLFTDLWDQHWIRCDREAIRRRGAATMP